MNNIITAFIVCVSILLISSVIISISSIVYIWLKYKQKESELKIARERTKEAEIFRTNSFSRKDRLLWNIRKLLKEL